MNEIAGGIPFSSDTLRQPKREIANFVEQKGFPVPKRYSSLEEAMRSGKPFIVRSEHPQDFNGGSGILDSLLVSRKAIADCATAYQFDPPDWEAYFKRGGSFEKANMARRILARIWKMTQAELEENLIKLSTPRRQDYCHYAKLVEDEFTAQISYSYWEALPGLNRTVVADSAIENQYHILTVKKEASQGIPVDVSNNHFVVKKGKIIRGKTWDLPEDSDERISSLIETYEGIRHLDGFSKGNCPLMELQSTKEGHYFLQYYQGREFIPSQFKLQRPPKPGEIKAFFVRGATSLEGLFTEVKIEYRLRSPSYPNEAALDRFVIPMHLEAVAHQRKLQIISTPHKKIFFNEDKGHMPRSRLFKPEISAVFILSDLESFLKGLGWSSENPMPIANAHLISDGRRAYLSRV